MVRALVTFSYNREFPRNGTNLTEETSTEPRTNRNPPVSSVGNFPLFAVSISSEDLESMGFFYVTIS